MLATSLLITISFVLLAPEWTQAGVNGFQLHDDLSQIAKIGHPISREAPVQSHRLQYSAGEGDQYPENTLFESLPEVAAPEGTCRRDRE
jgi:hypothetical protein